MIPATVAARAASIIGRARFESIYFNLNLTTVRAAKELGVPVHQLPQIAEILELPTRKNSGARVHVSKNNLASEEIIAPALYHGTCFACPFARQCYDHDLVPLPCEIFLFLDERETVTTK